MSQTRPFTTDLIYQPTKDETVVLYHKNCNDGIASAYVAYLHYGENARYIEFQYGDDLPADIIGRHVIMIDVSVPQETINHLLIENRILSIMLIDHHVSVIRQLKGGLWCPSVEQYENRRNEHDRYFYLTDVNHSGAALAWAFFTRKEGFRNQLKHDDLPLAIAHIQDYDLWRRKLANTDAVNAWLANGPRTIERFHSMVTSDGSIRMNVLEGGNLLVNAENVQVQDYLNHYVEYGYYEGEEIVLVNAPYILRNQIADELLKERWAFVVIYQRRGLKTHFSLRSAGYDVTPVGERFGGGGHKTASAFVLTNVQMAGRTALDLFDTPSFWQRVRRAWTLLTNPSLKKKETRRAR